MIEHLAQICERECGLRPESPVLVGVSGGADSLCLLHILKRLGYPAIVAHYNHGLRPEAGEDAAYVGRLAAELELPFILEGGNVRLMAEENGMSLEEAARAARYDFLFEQARRVGAQAVAVAHTADDQVETILMHLLRGSGLSGLRGMRYRMFLPGWSEAIPLVRPLLGVWRSEVESYLSEHNLAPLQDASNLDLVFYRNRLRHHLLPILETYNPQIKKLLLQTADLLQEDEAVLEDVTESAWEDSLLEITEAAVALDRKHLDRLALGLRRRVLRKAMNRLRPGLRDISYETIERALSFLSSPGSAGKIDLADGLYLLREGERVWIAEWSAALPSNDWPALESDQPLELSAPGIVRLSNDWVLEASIATLEVGTTIPPEEAGPFKAWLDLERVELPLKIRPRQPGDRFRPLGMGGHTIKLSDYFINLKLPQRARSAWPIVFSGDEIAWLPGYGPGEPFRLTTATKRVLLLRLYRKQAES